MSAIRLTIIFILTLLNLCLVGVSAQDYKAELVIDKEEIKIGEQIEALLSVSFPVTDHMTFTPVNDTLIKEIEVIERFKIDTNYTESNLSVKHFTQKLILTSFDTGYHTIPPIWFFSSTDSAKTDPLLIHVIDVPVEMSENATEENVEIKDIKNIIEVDFSIVEWVKQNWYWLCAFLLLIAAIFYYVKYLHPKWKENKARFIPAKKVIPAHEIALKKLMKLKSKKLWQSGKVKAYHIELSDIVRTYIENGFGIPALESTTGELIESLKNSKFLDQQIVLLNESLTLADLVKFAKLIPIGDENEKCYSDIVEFIHQTKPKETEALTNDGAQSEELEEVEKIEND